LHEARQQLAENLRKIRRENGLSQEGLAEACGLHRTYVSSVERGERNISIDNIGRLAEALGCTVVELVRPG